MASITNTKAMENCVRMKQLYKAKQALDEIKIAYIQTELRNVDTFGNWEDDEGLWFERGMYDKPIFISWDSLELWAEKHFAEAANG